MKFLFLLLGLFVLIFLVASSIYAQEGLPTITIVCEDRSGALFSFNDGFSVFKKCPKGNRRVIIIGMQGMKGEKGDKGDPGPQGPEGDQGNPGWVPDKEIDVCFHVPNGNLRVMITQDCGTDVHWKIPVKCVEGKPCKPDNPIGPFQ